MNFRNSANRVLVIFSGHMCILNSSAASLGSDFRILIKILTFYSHSLHIFSFRSVSLRLFTKKSHLDSIRPLSILQTFCDLDFGNFWPIQWIFSRYSVELLEIPFASTMALILNPTSVNVDFLRITYINTLKG